MAEMQGGTFTISNGGVYGSLMSSPILNPPQSGILGMHKIQQRPMVVNGEIKARPMMYLALSYDHRIVDGKGAVTFLVRVKDALEDPAPVADGFVRSKRTGGRTPNFGPRTFMRQNEKFHILYHRRSRHRCVCWIIYAGGFRRSRERRLGITRRRFY